jgi:acyl carrier protein
MMVAGGVEAIVVDMIEQALSRAARPARAAPVTATSTLSELGVGSMLLLELATAIEDRLAIQLPIDAVARARSVGELIALVAASVALAQRAS